MAAPAAVSDVTARAFDESQPKMIVILGYQRTGSTFTGKIFDMNPDVFTVFEPIDGIYGAMYGARPGFAVPSDIANHWDGTERWVGVPEVGWGGTERWVERH